MKRALVFILVVVLIVCLSACVPVPKNNSGESGTVTSQETTEPTEAATEAVIEAVSPGNYIQKNSFKFIFEKASLYNEIGDNEFLKQNPDEGKQFLVCFFEVENVSSEDQYVNPLYISAYLDDYDIGTEAIFSDVDGYGSLSGNLAPGKKTKGFICFQVGEKWSKLEITYTDGVLDGQTYDFVVAPENIT